MGPSCAPSTQIRKSGPNGPRKNSSGSSNPCVSVKLQYHMPDVDTIFRPALIYLLYIHAHFREDSSVSTVALKSIWTLNSHLKYENMKPNAIALSCFDHLCPMQCSFFLTNVKIIYFLEERCCNNSINSRILELNV